MDTVGLTIMDAKGTALENPRVTKDPGKNAVAVFDGPQAMWFRLHNDHDRVCLVNCVNPDRTQGVQVCLDPKRVGAVTRAWLRRRATRTPQPC